MSREMSGPDIIKMFLLFIELSITFTTTLRYISYMHTYNPHSHTAQGMFKIFWLFKQQVYNSLDEDKKLLPVGDKLIGKVWQWVDKGEEID